MTSGWSFATRWKAKEKVSMRKDESHAIHEDCCGMCGGCGGVVFAHSRGEAGMEARGLRAYSITLYLIPLRLGLSLNSELG